MDAIAEVKVLSSAYQAEYGRSSGLQISGVTKSGTNQFHGSFFDIERNGTWNANSWSNEQNGIAKPVTRERDYGYTIGGPIGRAGVTTACSSSTPINSHPARREALSSRRLYPPCLSVKGISLNRRTTPARSFPSSETRARVCPAPLPTLRVVFAGCGGPRANSSEPSLSARAQRSRRHAATGGAMRVLLGNCTWSRSMCGLAWMWNDDNVDNARIHLETHGRSHDISLLGTSKNLGASWRVGRDSIRTLKPRSTANECAKSFVVPPSGGTYLQIQSFVSRCSA